MGLMDAFSSEDRVEVKFSDFYNFMKGMAKAEMMMNGIKCETPYAYMREMMTGKREEAAHAASEISVHIKPIICGIDTGSGESESNLPWETPGQAKEEAKETEEAQEEEQDQDTKESEG